MLNLILGRNSSGKTEYVRNLIAKGVKNGNSGFVMIVPEQFSYETEKCMLKKAGAAGMLEIEVLSFSRLADVILEKYDKASDKQPVDDSVRAISMSLAIENLGDNAKIFKKYISRPTLIDNLISFATEIKQYDVATNDLKLAADKMKPSSLKEKLTELSHIISLYNAIISQSFYDSLDSLSLLAEVLDTHHFFENKTVVVDGFFRFTKQELKVIERIISQSNETYFTFCTDKEKDNEFSLFHNVNMQVDIIKQIANKRNVKIATPVFINESSDKNEILAKLDNNVFRDDAESFDTKTDGVITICSAPNITEECDFVACSIKKLIRENGVRCRDIIVFERTKGTYDKELFAAFRKYGVPFYEDKRQPIDTQPIIVFVRTLLDMAVNGITTDAFMRYLKTGLSALDYEEVSELENYAFLWKITGSQWGEDFKSNPRGLGVETNDFDLAVLEKLNLYRKKAVSPVLKFRKDFKESKSEEKSKLIYEFLERNKTAYKLKESALKLLTDGKTALFEEQNSVWIMLMDMLDKLYLAAKSSSISSERYYELFNILVAVSDLGALPQGLDNVMLGVADRTRTTNKKYVFIVGANDGVFPLNPPTKGLLNDNERIKLREYGIELAQTADYKYTEEQFMAYSALAVATDGLVVSYSASDYSGNTMTASDIVSSIKNVFLNAEAKSVESIDDFEKIESKLSAFEILAENYKYNNELKATLKEFFKEDVLFKGRLKSLDTAMNKSQMHIADKELAKELFGKDMMMSASKTEVYYKCPFEYFCKYGIKAEPRKEAQLDAALGGSVVHYVFEKMLSDYSKQQLLDMSDNMLRAGIDEILKNYLNDKMGGTQDKSKRFLKQYSTVSQQSFTILKRMIEEFSVCDFTPVDFELSIRPDGEISPYKLKLDDGGSLEIVGSVDRVDVMEKDGKKYLRVVDYKSGGKSFNLYDVLGGLSTQMLIYLFAIEANGNEKYGDIVSSGILYMSAKPESADLGRNASEEEINKKRLLSNRMSGIVLDDINVILGMENDGKGIFIPVSIDNDGNVKGKVISHENFKKLKLKVDTILKDMGTSLHNGEIPILPVGESACLWCDYKAVCCFEKGNKVREIEKIPDKAVFSILDEEVAK